MENAVDALKIAFAVMVFVIALTVSINAFNKVKATADIVLYSSDETNYYEYTQIAGKAAENRIVGMETIIPTLYKYYKENYTIVFRQANYNEETGVFSNIEPLEIYETKTNSRSWVSTYENLMKSKYSINQKTKEYIISENYNPSTSIFSFDLEEETLRHEPWTGSYVETKKNIDKFLSGGAYINPATKVQYINYSRGFMDKYKNKKFVETIAEYTYSSSQTQEDNSTISSLTKEKTKRIIIFTLIK